MQFRRIKDADAAVCCVSSVVESEGIYGARA